MITLPDVLLELQRRGDNRLKNCRLVFFSPTSAPQSLRSPFAQCINGIPSTPLFRSQVSTTCKSLPSPSSESRALATPLPPYRDSITKKHSFAASESLEASQTAPSGDEPSPSPQLKGARASSPTDDPSTSRPQLQVGNVSKRGRHSLDDVSSTHSLQERVALKHAEQVDALPHSGKLLLQRHPTAGLSTAIDPVLIKCGFCSADCKTTRGRLVGLESHWQHCGVLKGLKAGNITPGGVQKQSALVLSQRSLLTLFNCSTPPAKVGAPSSCAEPSVHQSDQPLPVDSPRTLQAAPAYVRIHSGDRSPEDLGRSHISRSDQASDPVLQTLTASFKSIHVSISPQRSSKRGPSEESDILQLLQTICAHLSSSSHSAGSGASHDQAMTFISELSNAGLKVHVSLTLQKELSGLNDSQRVLPDGFCFYQTLAAMAAASSPVKRELKPFDLSSDVDRGRFVSIITALAMMTEEELQQARAHARRTQSEPSFGPGASFEEYVRCMREQVEKYHHVIRLAETFTEGTRLPVSLWGGELFWEFPSLSQHLQIVCWLTNGEGALTSTTAVPSLTNVRARVGPATERAQEGNPVRLESMFQNSGVDPLSFYELLMADSTQHCFKLRSPHYEIFYTGGTIRAKFLACMNALKNVCFQRLQISSANHATHPQQKTASVVPVPF